MNTEKILEGLSQEERLELLERLIQRASPVLEEGPNIEERTDQLVEALGSGRRQARHGRRAARHGMAGEMGCQCGCS